MSKEVKNITIRTDYITLGQLLKFADVVMEGGEAKAYLASNKILVNGVEENRRGKKIRSGDIVELHEMVIQINHQ